MKFDILRLLVLHGTSEATDTADGIMTMVQYVIAQQNLPGLFLTFLPIALIFYLLIYRPTRKRQKNLETMIANLKNGHKVITNGGIYGTVAGIKEDTVLLKVADQVKMEVAKSAIASLRSTPGDSGTK